MATFAYERRLNVLETAPWLDDDGEEYLVNNSEKAEERPYNPHGYSDDDEANDGHPPPK